MDNDAKYVALAKAIAQKESKNNPNIYGDNGTSFGLGQWNNLGKPLKKGELPAVWKEHARTVFGNENTPMTEQNQKAVLTGMVKKWADEGLQPYEIAAKWNSGSNKGWENKVGTTMVNGKPLKYDTPSYVKEVDNLFRQFSQNIPQSVATEQPVAQAFDIPEVKEVNKLGRLQSEAQQAQAESKKANSFLGKAGNFGKALAENLIPSEIGLGKTLQKVYGNQSETYTKLIQDVSNQQANLIKAIKEKEAKQGDATSLKRIYNDNLKQLAELNKNLTEETNLPSTGKVVGQLGGTALDILTAGAGSKALKSGKLATKSPVIQKVATATGLPELGKLATQKASGIATLKGLGNIGTGAGIGYASDVSMGLQGLRGEDREGAKALIPGLGTAIGTTIPTISEGVQTFKNLTDPNIKAKNLIDKRQTVLNKLDKYQTIKKATEKGTQRGIDIKKLLAETDVLAGTVDNTGTIATKGEDGAIAQYTKQFIDGNESIVSDLLKKENRSISPALVKARLIQQVKKAGIEGKNLTSALKSIDDEVAGYMLRANEQGNIPVSIIHDAKIDKYNGINFFTEGATKKYDKTIAKALKEIVEETTTSADIKKVNEELSKHFAVIDYLNKLDNKKVDDGKLGKYFAQTVGAIVGSNFGPLGAIAGAEAGGMVKGNLMQRSFGGTTGKIPQQAEVITEALKVKNAPPLELPQSKSKSLGNLKTNQTTTMMKTKNSNIPKSSTKSATKSIDIISEAKKYKTAEDFVKAQGEFAYRGEGGSNIAQGKALLAEGKHFASDAEYPKRFGKVGEYVLKPKAKVLDLGDSTFVEISQKLGIPERNYISPKELASIAKEKGYDVVKYTGEYKSTGKQFSHTVDLTGDSYVAKSQLIDLWNKANAGNKVNPLIQEAKKYKSAEEFVKAKTNALHGSDTEITEFSKNFLGKNTESKGSKDTFFFTSSKEMADEYGRGAFLKKKVGEIGNITKEQRPQLLAEAKGKAKINEVSLDYKNPKIIKQRGLLKDNQVAKDIQKAKEQGYDAIIYQDVVDPVLGDSEKFIRGDITAIFDSKNIKTKSQLTDIWKKANN